MEISLSCGLDVLKYFCQSFHKKLQKKSLHLGNIHVIVLSSRLLYCLCNSAEFSVINPICVTAKPLLALSILIAKK